MWDDCGRTGCTGGGTFLLIVFGLWVIGSWAILISEPESSRAYIKSFPMRVIVEIVFTTFCLGLGWLVSQVEGFLFF
jgi:hypothetical protein